MHRIVAAAWHSNLLEGGDVPGEVGTFAKRFPPDVLKNAIHIFRLIAS
jgi:hypothetical protein